MTPPKNFPICKFCGQTIYDRKDHIKRCTGFRDRRSGKQRFFDWLKDLVR